MNKRLTPILIITSALWLFGLSAKAQDRSTGPTIGGSVYGGGKGSSATVTDNVSVEFSAGTVGTYNTGTTTLTEGTGDIYGGGKQAVVDGATTVELKGGTVRGDLYGGGALANVTSNATVTLTGGSTRMVFGGGMGNTSGTQAEVGGTTNVTISNGTVRGDVIATVGTGTNAEDVRGAVFGGCNVNGSVGGAVAVNANGGSIGGNVYGGGLGDLTTTGAGVTVTIEGATITGDVYGGSALGKVNNAVTDLTKVELKSGSLTNLYGGGMGQTGEGNEAKGCVNGRVEVLVEGGSVTDVFGCNNYNGAPQGDVTVTVEKVNNATWSVGNVYGGGNQASYSGPTPTNERPNNPVVLVKNGTITNNVYGGGLGSTAKVLSNPKVTFGDATTGYSVTAVNVYGGGSAAEVGNSATTPKVIKNAEVLVQTNASAAKVFGGGMSAGVTGTTTLTISDGSVTAGVYGGCDSSGEVGGNITVNVNGGTIGTDTDHRADVFGGGYGENTFTSGNVTVSFGVNDTHNEFPKLYGDVYGGSALGSVNTDNSNTTTVNILNGTLVTNPGTDANGFTTYTGGNVFGGGLGETGAENVNKGKVNGKVEVNIGTFTANAVALTVGDHTGNSYSGNAVIGGCVYGCNNTNGSPQDMVTVNVYQTAHTDGTGGTPNNTVDGNAYAIANVFGGGNLANYTATGKTTVNVFSCDNTIGRTFGGGNAAATPSVETDIKGGRIGQVFGGGNGEVSAANINGDVRLGIHGGDVGQTFGGSNTSGNISGEITIVVDETGCGALDIDEFFCGGNFADIFGGLTTDITCSAGMRVKNIYGGCNMANIWGDVVLNLYGGEYEESVFGGSKGDLASLNDPDNGITGHVTKAADILKYPASDYDWDDNPNNYPEALQNYMASHPTDAGKGGNVTLNLYGGTMTNAFGGSNVNGNIEGVITVNVLDNGGTCGLEVHNIYGGSNVTAYTPNYDLPSGVTERVSPVVNLIHGTVSTITDPNTGVVTGGNVYGGSKGGNNVNATVTASPKVTIGYDATTMGTLYSQLTLNNTNYTSTTQPADFHAVVGGNVYGGGDAAAVAGNTSVLMQKSNSQVAHNIFGGGNLANVTGATTVNVNEGAVAQDVYGGGALANTGGSNVTLGGGTVTQDIYGGGLGDGNHPAAVSGAVYVTVNSGSVRDVYGCNNVNGAPTEDVQVDINGAVGGNVYGGGNQALSTIAPIVNINAGANVAGSVFGGGNQAGVGGGNVNIVGGTVQGGGVATGGTGGVFGGCNTNGEVGGDITVNVTGGTIGGTNRANIHGGGFGSATTTTGNVTLTFGDQAAVSTTPTLVGDIYGGSALGNVGTSGNTIIVNVINGSITGDVYGGGLGSISQNQAAVVNGNVEVHIGKHLGTTPTLYNHAVLNTYGTGGTQGGNVFGCNNEKGAPTGTVKVYVNGDVPKNVYGGGNQAACGISPAVYVYKGTVSGGVFGGGLGSTAVVTGAPTVTVGDLTVGHEAYEAIVNNDVYGGGDAANVIGTPVVLVQKCNTTINGDVYGGGNAADVSATSVTVTGGMINSTDDAHGNVFGGGHGDKDATPNPISANVSGNTSVTINGGTVKRVFGGSNSKGDIGGSTLVNVVKDDNACDLHITEVYGGGNLADGKSGQVTIGCTGSATEGVGDVYGGAKAANLTGDITLNITGGTIDRVFGGNNVSGNINGDITVNVEWSSGCSNNSLNYVYGGGNQAAYTQKTAGHPQVNIKNGTVSHDVFGGGLGSTASVTGNPVVNIQGGTVSGTTFGGGSLAPVTGNPTVNALYGTAQTIHGGGLGASAIVTGNPKVVVNQTPGKTLTVTDVFGGGDAAGVTGNTTVQLQAGAVTNAFGGGNVADITGTTSVSLEGTTATAASIYGGGNEASVSSTTTVNVSNGSVTTGVYGGCNTSGTVGGTATVNVTGGTVGTDADHTANIYGGGLGESTRMSGDVAVNIGATSGGDNPTYSGDATIYGDVYGGSAKGKTNCNAEGTSHQDNTKTDVALYSGTIHGDLYGGGHGPTGETADVWGPVWVKTKGGSVNNVFGGNNVAGMPKSTVQVDIQGGAIGSNVYGGGNLAIYGTGSSNYPVVNITSGTVANVFGGGMGSTDPSKGVVTGNPQVTVDGGTVSSNVYGGGQLAKTIGNPNVSVSSGSAAMVFGGGMQAGIHGAPTVNIQGGSVADGVYGGCNVSGIVENKATVLITSGTIGVQNNANRGVVYGGGLGENTKVKGDVAVTVNGTSTSAVNIWGDVYGGSAKGKVNCNDEGTQQNPNAKTEITLTDGTVHGDLYGGGHGPTGEIADVFGPVTVAVNGGLANNVFGGNNVTGTPKNTIQVNVGGGTINYNVYGGGNQAAYTYNTGNYPEVNITNGTVGTNVYGGGLGATAVVTGNPKVTVNGGTVTGNVFGGGSLAVVDGATHVIVSSGTAGYVYGGGAYANTGVTMVDILGGTINNDIFGGGLGGGTNPSTNQPYAPSVGEVTVNIGAAPATTGADPTGDATIHGSVYGCNNEKGSPTGDVTVHIWKTRQEGETQFMNGTSYGTAYAIDQVFGGGNKADYTVADKKAHVYLHGCYNTVRRVFGGGNAAATWGSVTEIDGGRYDYIFGGGNGEVSHADIGAGGINLTIRGGKINQFFGGSNQSGTIGGPIEVTATSGDCDLDIENFFCGSNQVDIAGDVNTTITCNGSMNVTNLYGGSNLADIGGSVTLTVKGGTYTNVFGGSKGRLASTGVEAKAANITHDVTLNLYGGTIENAFGGSDVYGNIGGKITVNVIDDGSMNTATPPVATCPLVLNNVYGGGRDAAYTPTDAMALSPNFSPEVNIIHGAVTKKAIIDPNTNQITGYTGGNVFGGGLGTTAVVTSNPKVTIGYASGYTYPGNATQPSTPKAEVYGNVYGGGEQASVAGSTTVTVQKDNTRVHTDVYGGGALANTQGSTVTLTNGMVNDIYGGGLGRAAATGVEPVAAEVTGPVQVTVNGGTVHDVYGANNVNGGPTNTVQVNINSSVTNNVYGGGNQAAFTGSPKVYVNHGTVVNVFGGGKGDPTGDGTTAMVTGTPEVTIGDATESHCAVVSNNVYGGGDAAKVTGNTKVTYNDNNSSSTVAQLFGGGNAAGVTGTTEVNMNLGKVTSGIFGGCNSKGTVGGAINVNIKGGTLGANGAALAEGIYGGGYGKDTETGDNVTVTIGYGGTTPAIYGDVYGGSALGKVGVSSKLTKVDFLNGTLNGTLYGGGKGQTGNTPVAAEVKGDVQVAIANGSISGGVYGGCNLNGDVKGDITVGIAKGTIGTITTARANVHGGGLGSATTTKGAVTVNIAANNATEGPTIYGDLYGGSGFGQVSASDKLTQVNFYKGTINGDIYGGGLGSNEHSAEVSGNVEVNIRGGVFNSATGTVGGGQVFGCNNAKGTPKGNVAVHIYGTDHGADPAHNKYPTGITTAAQLETNSTTQTYAIAAVYGGGNLASYEPVAEKSTTVYVHNCDNTLKDVFGGGNAANVGTQSVSANTYINIDGGRINRVFGGGNGQTSAANIYGTATTTINAGLIDQIFGGGNVSGTISNTSLNLAKTGSCTDEVFREVFGGANLAPIAGVVNTTINCGVGTIGEIYGGSNLARIGTEGTTDATVNLTINGGEYQYVFGGSKGANNNPANIYGHVNLNLHGGTIANAFGGSNVEGNVSGKITVDVLDNEGSCPLILTNVYGGGNLAYYHPNTATLASPEVNIKHIKQGNSITNVYGGGYGSSAEVKAYPVVTIGDTESTHYATVSNNVYGGGEQAPVTGSPTVIMQNGHSTALNIFGGGNLADVSAGTIVNLNGGTVSQDVYGGGALANVGGSNVTLAGGTVRTLYGGGMGNTTTAALVDGNAQVTVSSGIINGTEIDATTHLKGGVFGGCNVNGTVNGGTTVQINGPVGAENNRVNIYGGGLGENTNVVGNVAVTVAATTNTVYGDVYGGSAKGLVNYNYNNNAIPTVTNSNTTSVTMNSGVVEGDVYGGGHGLDNKEANVGGPVTVTVNGGNVNRYSVSSTEMTGGRVFGCNNLKGEPKTSTTVDIKGGAVGYKVFGGGNLADAAIGPHVIVEGGTVYDVYGGGAYASTGATVVDVLAGTVYGDVYGGCLGGGDYSPAVNGTAIVNIGSASTGNATFGGSVYGGNDAKGSPTGNATVNIYKTAHTTTNTATYVANDATYAIMGVFGGGNLADFTGPEAHVNVYGCDNTIQRVFGGGNAASTKDLYTTIQGGRIDQVFGGGNGYISSNDAADVNGSVTLNVNGGDIRQVFGAGNEVGTISGTITLNVDKSTGTCPMYIEEVYGGANLAAGKAGTINIGCTGDLATLGSGEHYGVDQEGIRYVYGGSNDADVTGDITLNINSGIVENVFGGNNTGHAVNGKITVNINQTNTSCGWYVGNVFGGGNLALYSAPSATVDYPQVNILNGLVSGDVFGGGLGSTGDAGKVTGNPQVTVNGSGAAVNGGVYGGGSLAPTQGNPVVTLTNGTLAKVFGGGKAADVTGAPTVGITGGSVSTGVYGGCDSQGNVTGDITVNITGGTIGSQANLDNNVTANIYGGGYGESTTTSGNVTVTFGTAPAPSATPTLNESLKIYGDIYGGSALGQVNANSGNNTTTVNVLDGQLISNVGTDSNGFATYTGGNVFGGGLGQAGDANVNKGKVNGKVFVNIGAPTRALDPTNDLTTFGNAAIGGNVYGCNNTNGSPQDDVTVNIYRTYRRDTDQINYTPTSTAPATYAIANVFGGGNRANYTASNKTANVNIFSCYNSIRRLFGGGNAAAAPNVHTTIQGGRFEEVFGGGNGEVSAANITGNVNLEIHGGTIGSFFAGSNQNGSIAGTSNVTIDQVTGCEDVNITEFYCGGKYADFIGDINATITCAEGMNVTNLYGGCKEAHVKAGNGGNGNIHLIVNGGTFQNVYGGSKGTLTKGADVEGNIVLDIYGGTITNAIFGGSNVKGAIGGSITVNVEQKTGAAYCPLDVHTVEVYGGGNQADYPGVPASDSPITGTITHTSPYNYPEINIKNATVRNVFGGGLNAEVTGNPQIKIKKGSKVLGNVYGGGNMGEVNGDPRVIVNGKME